MPDLYEWLLFLHVLGAIVALGPALAFPVIEMMGGREPEHGNFATRVTHLLDDRVVLPFVLSTAVTGFGLIWVGSMPLFEPAYRWLLLSLVLYAIALVFSWFVQRPTVLRVISLTGGFPAATLQPAAATAGMPAGGPPAGLEAAIGRTRVNGLVLTFLTLQITFLMVVKPPLA